MREQVEGKGKGKGKGKSSKAHGKIVFKDTKLERVVKKPRFTFFMKVEVSPPQEILLTISRMSQVQAIPQENRN